MGADDPYESATKSKLKFKGNDDGVKKKKKKNKKLQEQLKKAVECEQTEVSQAKSAQRTKAELAFKQMQEKNQTKRILEKASMTHKERVEKFNQHLDGLTEHFDIPKVSWTK